MKIVYGNSYNQSHTDQAYAKKQAKNDKSVHVPNGLLNTSQSKNKALKKQQERENEIKLRESEDKLIKEYQQQISDIKDTPMDSKSKEVKISSLMEQIQDIYANRAQREQAAIQREIEEQKAEMEEKEKAEKQRQDKAVKTDEEREEALRREDIKNMTALSQSNESLRGMKRVRATMAAEATRLEQDIENTYGFEQIGHDIKLKVKSGWSTPNDFRNKHLTGLTKGISGLDSAIATNIRDMYKTASEWSKKKTDILSQPTSEKSTDKVLEKETAATDKTANAESEKKERDNEKEETNPTSVDLVV